MVGHPLSGASWGGHVTGVLKLSGFTTMNIGVWIFTHKKLKVAASVCVDDFNMSAAEENMERGWSNI